MDCAGGIKGQPQQAAAAAAAAAAAVVEEGQVCSKPAVWPVPQPAVKRQRSRLYQSPNAPSDLLTSPAPAVCLPISHVHTPTCCRAC